MSAGNILSSTLDIITRQIEEKEAKKVNLESVYSSILDTVSSSSDESEIVESLETGIRVLKNKNKSDFPTHLFGDEAVRLIIDRAMEVHNTPVSISALHFIEFVFFVNKDFGIDVIRDIEGYDFVAALFEYLQQPETTDEEASSVLTIIAFIAKKDEDSRNHVHEVFPFGFMKEVLEAHPNTLPQFALYCKSMTSFPIPDNDDILLFAKESCEIVAACTLKDPKVAARLLECLLDCMKMTDVTGVICPPDDFVNMVNYYITQNVYNNSVGNCLFEMCNMLFKNLKKLILNSSFLNNVLLPFIDFPLPVNRKARDVIEKVICLLTKMVRVDANCAPFIFNKDKRDILMQYISEGTIPIRYATSRLCISCFESKTQCPTSIKMIFLHKNITIKIADFLEHEDEKGIIIALRFIFNMVSFAKSERSFDFIYHQISDIHDTVEELVDHENPEIKSFAMSIMHYLFDESEAVETEEEEAGD